MHVNINKKNSVIFTAGKIHFEGNYPLCVFKIDHIFYY